MRIRTLSIRPKVPRCFAMHPPLDGWGSRHFGAAFWRFGMSVQTPSKGCQLNPNGWWIDTLKPFGIPLKVLLHYDILDNFKGKDLEKDTNSPIKQCIRFMSEIHSFHMTFRFFGGTSSLVLHCGISGNFSGNSHQVGYKNIKWDKGSRQYFGLSPFTVIVTTGTFTF